MTKTGDNARLVPAGFWLRDYLIAICEFIKGQERVEDMSTVWFELNG